MPNSHKKNKNDIYENKNKKLKNAKKIGYFFYIYIFFRHYLLPNLIEILAVKVSYDAQFTYDIYENKKKHPSGVEILCLNKKKLWKRLFPNFFFYIYYYSKCIYSVSFYPILIIFVLIEG